MNISNLLVGVISIIIFVFALIQIITFYNININFFSVYISYYVFMASCIYIFGFDSINSNEFEGLMKEINMTTRKGKIVTTMFSSDHGNVEMTSVST